jgi:hypothetical protein
MVLSRTCSGVGDSSAKRASNKMFDEISRPSGAEQSARPHKPPALKKTYLKLGDLGNNKNAVLGEISASSIFQPRAKPQTLG